MKHPLHQAVELIAGTTPLVLMGMGHDTAWLLAFAVSVQFLLQHSNVDMQIGPLAREGESGPLVEIAIHVEPDVTGTLDDGTALALVTVERLGCDAAVVAVTDGSDGEEVGVGRHYPPAAARRNAAACSPTGHGCSARIGAISVSPWANTPLAASATRHRMVRLKRGCDSTITTRTSPGANPHCSCTALRSCRPFKCQSPKFQPRTMPPITSPSFQS